MLTKVGIKQTRMSSMHLINNKVRQNMKLNQLEHIP